MTLMLTIFHVLISYSYIFFCDISIHLLSVFNCFLIERYYLFRLPWGSVVKNHPPNAVDMAFWVEKIPWRRKWQPTPVFLPGKSHRQRSLVGYSPWGCKESDTNTLAYISLNFFPYSCLCLPTYLSQSLTECPVATI